MQLPMMQRENATVPASFQLSQEAAGTVLRVRGDWTVWTVSGLDAELQELGSEASLGAAIDVRELHLLDVAGAYLIDRTVRGGSPCGYTDVPVRIVGSHPNVERLLGVARGAARPCPLPPLPYSSLSLLLERAGRGVSQAWLELLDTISFLGKTLTTLASLALHPQRIRWANMFTVMETAGLNALPIISILSFFIGIVVAYLGARILADFGASIFTVELVAYAILREFGVVITAVLLAGRTASAFTAELGSMKMRQEIDAMRVLGINPMQALVAPRVLALVAMTPLLTFLAVIAGLAGGVTITWGALGISPLLFLSRIQESVPIEHFFVGMIKAPIFALLIAITGCRHGLQTGSDVASLGRRVTTAVVQSIFFVVVLDAIFALWFIEIGW